MTAIGVATNSSPAVATVMAWATTSSLELAICSEDFCIWLEELASNRELSASFCMVLRN